MKGADFILRVAAYCRVSTDSNDQSNSFEGQQRYFKEYIKRNPEWNLVKIYADKGVSGTDTKRRKEFNQMITAAKSGNIDLIITKEVSRFARNTLDTLQYTRDLKQIKVGVLFMNDNINTMDADGELRLTIMASIAQEESRKISERVKWGQKQRMQQGIVFGRDMLGYDVQDGKLFINKAGAEIVQLIFHKFVEEGKGTHIIARELREAGIETSTRMKEWSNVVILRILRNEKYCGDLIQKKTFTPDFLSHHKKYNHGEEEFVALQNHHEAIISRELFEKAQKELERRSPYNKQGVKYSNRYCLSGKIVCGCCGSRFVSRAKNRQDGSRYKAWRCSKATKYGLPKIDVGGNLIGCFVNQQISNEDFMSIIQMTIKHLCHNKEYLINELIEIIRMVFVSRDDKENDIMKLEHRLKVTSEKKEKLLDIYLGNEITESEYHHMSERYEKEKADLQRRIKNDLQKKELAQNQEERISDIVNTVRKLTLGEQQNDTFYRNIVEKIVVYNRKYIEIYLKSFPYRLVYKMEK